MIRNEKIKQMCKEAGNIIEKSTKNFLLYFDFKSDQYNPGLVSLENIKYIIDPTEKPMGIKEYFDKYSTNRKRNGKKIDEIYYNIKNHRSKLLTEKSDEIKIKKYNPIDIDAEVMNFSENMLTDLVRLRTFMEKKNIPISKNFDSSLKQLETEIENYVFVIKEKMNIAKTEMKKELDSIGEMFH